MDSTINLPSKTNSDDTSLNIHSFALSPELHHPGPRNISVISHESAHINNIDWQVEPDTQKLLSYATCYNMLRIGAKINYPTKRNFIEDVLPDCLIKEIITDEAGTNPIWAKLGITITDSDPVELHNPYQLLRYSDDKTPNPSSEPSSEPSKVYWPYSFKKVCLPNGWSLHKGCGCGTNMNPSCFTLVDDEGNTIETLAYFSDPSDPPPFDIFDLLIPAPTPTSVHDSVPIE